MAVERATGQDPDCEERLSPPKAVEEAKRLMAAFKDILPKSKRRGMNPRLYTHWPYHVELEQLPNGESLRASRRLSNIIQSVILVNREGEGGFHFIEAIRPGHYPEAHGHSATAIRKIEEFLEGLRQAIKAS